ncbi:hypothetical protein AB0M47_17375 [Hamadaea sp. NPDC051192]|uniref:hypothetical protein n=1 Tax=Hamadaea sp. NPDC051192 TaxID=3154940 RepID=UPI003436C4A1
METVHGVLIALAERYSFADVAALVAQRADPELSTREIAQVQQLCVFGQRLLDLDAEDFGEEHVPADLRTRALACRMPQAPGEADRGALASLRPAYALLLEVIAARWERREMTGVVAAVHIVSEYAPLLVWEQVLGHAGDPARLPPDVRGEHSLWGEDTRECPQTKAEKSAALRSLKVAHEPPSGWRAYLDRLHSITSHAFGVCAAACPRPCSVLLRHSRAEIELLGNGCKLATTLTDSGLVRLRHAAPVGHGFGVPSRDEVLTAWERGRPALARHAPAVAEPDGYPLPGFTALISALAGTPIHPSTLLADTARELALALK